MLLRTKAQKNVMKKQVISSKSLQLSYIIEEKLNKTTQNKMENIS